MFNKKPNIYISYRRDDSGFFTHVLQQALSDNTAVFRDVDSILPGDSLRDVTSDAIAKADIVLVVIGPNWLSIDEKGHKRLDNNNDFIRTEIESAISQNKLLLPILVDASMPSVEDLPDSLKPLLFNNAYVLRMGSDVDADVTRLTKVIHSLASKDIEPPPAPIDSEKYFSCFISYAHQDEPFCRRLIAKLRSVGMKVWFADEDMKGGMKIVHQIYNAIQRYDRLLLILSEHSINSDWVAKEIKRARRREQKEGISVLFPIRLCTMDMINDWELMDGSDDLASEVREYFIIDFSKWTEHDDFENSYVSLRESLRVAAGNEVIG